jgi:kynurenine formamidase
VRVIKVVDLTLPVDSTTMVYPGDPLIDVVATDTAADSGFNVHRITVGSHAGTHVDAPFHIDDDGARIDEVDLRLFLAPAVLLDVRHRVDRERITRADLAPRLQELSAGVIAVVHTGWTIHWGTPRYYAHPFLDPDACAAILERGVVSIAVDAMSIDETVDAEHPGEGWPCHQQVLGAGGVLIENLAHLDRIDFPDPVLSTLPLRLPGVDGSPVRAVALQLG